MRPEPSEAGNVGFRCEFCGRAFRSPELLARHRTSDHMDRPFAPRCDACGRTFETPADLKSHNQLAHGAPLD
jgi:uncharacterized C2H2 Zn-finger protein